MLEDDAGLGYLAAYGVMVVPPPADTDGGWFVTITRWNEDAERYLPSQEGPILDSEEEAFEEAKRALAWLMHRGDEPNLIEVWEMMQRQRTRGDIPPPQRTDAWLYPGQT